MTIEEFKALRSHTRIKYVGADPAVISKLQKEHRLALTKGIVVGYVHDYSTSSWDAEKGLCVRPWAGYTLENIKPVDWVVVDADRRDLARSREKRKVAKTDTWVRRELTKFSNQFRDMKSTKKLIDSWLEDVPLSERFRILTSLTGEQKAWLQLLSMDPEVVISAIKKIADEEEEIKVEPNEQAT